MYRKAMKRWPSGMLLFALALVLGAPASANLLYTVHDNNYASTSVGKIVGDTTIVLATNVGGNWGQVIFPFKRGAADRVAVTLYPNSNPYYSGDEVRIYDPASLNWSSPESTITHAHLKNVRALVFMGGHPYGIGYNCTPFAFAYSEDPVRRSAKVARWNHIGGTTYWPDNLYTHLFQYEAPSGYEANGEGLAAHGSFVYALFKSYTGNYPNLVYSPNKLVKLNAELGQVGALDLHGKNTDGSIPGAYCQSGSTLYLTSWGGPHFFISNWHPESRIEKVNLSGMSTETLVTGQQMHDNDPSWKHHFTAIALHGNTAYVQAATWKELPDTPFAMPGGEVRIYKCSMSDIGTLHQTAPVQTIATDAIWQLGMVQEGSCLWVAVGDRIHRYALPVTASSQATVFGSGSAIPLGGNISAFAPLPLPQEVSIAESTLDTLKQVKADIKEEKGNGKGCEAGFPWTGVLLAAAVPFVMRRRG